MVIQLPPTTKALGNKMVVILTTPPAAPTGIPTVTEVNTGIQASCFYYGDFTVTPTQNTGEGPRKMCSRKVPTQLGLVNYPAVEAQYSYMPQELGTPGHPGNALYEALEPDVEVTVVVLEGIDGQTEDVVAGDVADIYRMQAGARRKGQTGDGEYDEKSTTQSLIVVGGEAIAEDHPLAAA